MVVSLRGGQDALNTFVPFGDGMYYDLRPTIAIPAPDKAGRGKCCRLGNPGKAEGEQAVLKILGVGHLGHP